MSVSPRVTIIIPNWNTRRWLPGCLDALRAQSYRDFRVLLVDNGSTDDSVTFVREHYPEVEVHLSASKRGFAPTVNHGIHLAQSEYICLLNSDTVAHPDWLKELVSAIDHSPADVGGLASKMLSLQDPSRLDNAGDLFSWYGSNHKRGAGEPAAAYSEVTETISVCAGAALYRRSFLSDVGVFDERFESYLEDIDLGLRGRLLGYRYLYIPTAAVLHQSHGAGMPHARYVYLMTRNRLAVLLKNIPFGLLLRHWKTLAYGQIYYAIAYKRPWQTGRGLVSLILMTPHLLKQRRQILRRRSLSNAAFDALLSPDLLETPLSELIQNKARSLFGARS